MKHVCTLAVCESIVLGSALATVSFHRTDLRRRRLVVAGWFVVTCGFEEELEKGRVLAAFLGRFLSVRLFGLLRHGDSRPSRIGCAENSRHC